MVALRLLRAFAGAAMEAERIAALAIALLDDLATAQRAGTFGLRRDGLLRLADATEEADGDADRYNER